ncbi:MAG: hypothetical protein PHF28_06285 [Candidatus Methanomethylophilaceae archaeon]|jgi:hypothetical protein|nr:hypothetical protein [Candidatus Methanomethylophilaceae archaeon]
MDLPYKSEILKLFKEDREMWEYDAVAKLMDKNRISSDYWKWNARFWLMELSVAGFLVVVDTAEDDGAHFSKGKVLSKYKLTERGLQTIETMLED